MAKGDDLEDRLIRYAVRIINVAKSLPNTPEGRYLADHLLRSGMSPSMHYGEARSAESRRDFAHKLRIALKEMNESRICLKIIIQSELMKESLLTDLLAECEELCKILGSSIQTAQGNARNN